MAFAIKDVEHLIYELSLLFLVVEACFYLSMIYLNIQPNGLLRGLQQRTGNNTKNWYFWKKIKAVAKNTSILLGDYFDKFISQQIQSGRFSSASEVIRTALRLFEEEENRKSELVKELKKGEKSGFVNKFDRKKFIKELHDKYLPNEL